jgi:lipoprotein-anchoring transpeptidase ErfK/SrfK
MPHSIFFLGGYAIHGTGYVRSLGRPASHGCIRLAPGNAARLYSLVRQHGNRGTRIVINN